MKVQCAWCGKDMGEKPPYDDPAISHGICEQCRRENFPKTTYNLSEFRKSNCQGCFYADAKKVGSGRACCTYPQRITIKDGKCLTRKEVTHRKN